MATEKYLVPAAQSCSHDAKCSSDNVKADDGNGTRAK